MSFEQSDENQDRETTHVLKDTSQFLKNVYVYRVFNFLNPFWMRFIELSHFSEILKIDLW